MKKGAKRSLWIIGGLAGIFVLKTLGVFSLISTLPWWMYFVIAGILFSGYQFIKANQEDRQADQAFIEEQGQVYMERIEKARKKRSS